MLLDTCVAIDVLRGKQAALIFARDLADAPALCVITATELLAGVRNSGEQRQIEAFLETCTVYEVDLPTATLAGEYVRQYRRSHAVDPVDALIAATAAIRDLPLATLNLKHFPMFKGLKRPYPL